MEKPDDFCPKSMKPEYRIWLPCFLGGCENCKEREEALKNHNCGK